MAAAAPTIFSIVEDAGPVARAIERFGKLRGVPLTNRIGDASLPLRDFVLTNSANIEHLAEGFTGIGALGVTGGAIYSTHTGTPLLELHKLPIKNSLTKTKTITVKNGKVHLIEPFDIVRYPKHIVVDKNYSTKRYFFNNSLVNMPRTKTSKLASRLKRLEARVSPEVKYWESSHSCSALGANSILALPMFASTRGVQNNAFQGNEVKILRVEVFAQPLNGVTSTLSSVSIEAFLIRSKQAGLPLPSDFKGSVNDIGSLLDRDKGLTLKHWVLGLNNQTVKFKHRFRYPLRVHINDNQVVQQNQCYFVIKNSAAAALPAYTENSITIRVYYVDP